MFLVHRKGLTLDGNNPTLLYGYGGFNIVRRSDVQRRAARDSRTQGSSSHRRTCAAAANTASPGISRARSSESRTSSTTSLRPPSGSIANNYTSPARLAIQGGSNGGLLVGAVINQRPELFRVAIAQVGVMDMLRFQKFTIGWNWVADYGSSDDPEEFKTLFAYSPLHNIRTGVTYPATIVTTADHDDRVVPAHSFKYAATLQALASADNPVLIRIEARSGHGPSNLTKQLETTADVYAFMLYNLGVDLIVAPIVDRSTLPISRRLRRMTTARACVLSAILGVGAWAGWATLVADSVAAQTPQPAAAARASPAPIRSARIRSRKTVCRRGSSMGRSCSRVRSSPARFAATGSTCQRNTPSATPANVLVFQDGQRATNPTGSLRVPQVLENLIHKKDIPGHDRHLHHARPARRHVPGGSRHRQSQQSRRRVRLARATPTRASSSRKCCPEVGKTYNLTKDPAGRAIGGTSSGAICAFTVAWHRPDQFRNVISMIGSYTSIGYRPAQDGQPMVPGGDLYPTLIRKNPIKPIKIFLQDGSADLDNQHGSWFLANQQMLAALNYANTTADTKKLPGPRYEVKHEWGDGAHSDAHGGSLLPDILRWIYK